MFHDFQYGKDFPENVLDSIKVLIAQAVENEDKPLECIGFIIPMKVDLSNTVFKSQVLFVKARFANAVFRETTFTKEADFTEATFTKEANFIYITFSKEANFNGATFTEKANFRAATFTGKVEFSKVNLRVADFIKADFRGEVELFDVNFPSEQARKYIGFWEDLVKEEDKKKFDDFLHEALTDLVVLSDVSSISEVKDENILKLTFTAEGSLDSKTDPPTGSITFDSNKSIVSIRLNRHNQTYYLHTDKSNTQEVRNRAQTTKIFRSLDRPI